MKKTISVLLVLALLLTVLPLGAQAAPDGSFGVNYDTADGAAVELAGQQDPLPSFDWGTMTPYYDFTVGTVLDFTLTPPAPDGVSAGKPYRVEVCYDSEEPADLTSAVTGEAAPYTLSYTPAAAGTFLLNIWWSKQQYDFDMCMAGEGQIQLEVCAEGSGMVSFDGEAAAVVRSASYTNLTRIVLTGGTDSFALRAEPAPGEALESIRIEQEEPDTLNLENDARYNAGERTLTLSSLTDARYDNDQHNGKFIFVSFCFTGAPQEGGIFRFKCQDAQGQPDGELAFSADGGAGWATVTDWNEDQEGRFVYRDMDFATGTELQFRFAAAAGYQLDRNRGVNLWVWPKGSCTDLQEQDGVFSYTLPEVFEEGESFELEFGFENEQHGGDPGDQPGDNPGDDPGGDPAGEPFKGSDAQLQAVADGLMSYLFAYAGTKDEIRESMAKELTERRIGDAAAIGTEACALGELFQMNAASLSDLITLDAVETDAGELLSGMQYYPYTLTVKPAGNTDAAIEAKGRVYKLNSTNEIIVKASGTDAVSYSVVSLKQDTVTAVYADFVILPGRDERESGSPAIEAYGNGAMLNPIFNEDEDIQSYHVTQEHAGGLSGFPFGTRLAVSRNSRTVRLSYEKDAAAWGFVNTNIYGPGSTAESKSAEVFYGSDTITVASTVYDNTSKLPTVTDVAVLNLDEAAVSVEGTTLTLHTAYDYVSLKLIYSDGSDAYLDLRRVGLVMDAQDANGAPDQEHFGEELSAQSGAHAANWGADSRTFVVWHGTDHSVRYLADSGDEKLITATFYYDSNEPAAAERVSLYVTISYEDGSVERRLISEAITTDTDMKPVAVSNGGFIQDSNPDVRPGYAGQGSCHIYDDFVLWNGSREAFMNICSVSAIAFVDSGEESFGGIRVGSGSGVRWENN